MSNVVPVFSMGGAGEKSMILSERKESGIVRNIVKPSIIDDKSRAKQIALNLNDFSSYVWFLFKDIGVFLFGELYDYFYNAYDGNITKKNFYESNTLVDALIIHQENKYKNESWKTKELEFVKLEYLEKLKTLMSKKYKHVVDFLYIYDFIYTEDANLPVPSYLFIDEKILTFASTESPLFNLTFKDFVQYLNNCAFSMTFDTEKYIVFNGFQNLTSIGNTIEYFTTVESPDRASCKNETCSIRSPAQKSIEFEFLYGKEKKEFFIKQTNDDKFNLFNIKNAPELLKQKLKEESFISTKLFKNNYNELEKQFTKFFTFNPLFCLSILTGIIEWSNYYTKLEKENNLSNLIMFFFSLRRKSEKMFLFNLFCVKNYIPIYRNIDDIISRGKFFKELHISTSLSAQPIQPFNMMNTQSQIILSKNFSSKLKSSLTIETVKPFKMDENSFNDLMCLHDFKVEYVFNNDDDNDEEEEKEEMLFSAAYGKDTKKLNFLKRTKESTSFNFPSPPTPSPFNFPSPPPTTNFTPSPFHNIPRNTTGNIDWTGVDYVMDDRPRRIFGDKSPDYIAQVDQPLHNFEQLITNFIKYIIVDFLKLLDRSRYMQFIYSWVGIITGYDVWNLNRIQLDKKRQAVLDEAVRRNTHEKGNWLTDLLVEVDKFDDKNVGTLLHIRKPKEKEFNPITESDVVKFRRVNPFDKRENVKRFLDKFIVKKEEKDKQDEEQYQSEEDKIAIWLKKIETMPPEEKKEELIKLQKYQDFNRRENELQEEMNKLSLMDSKEDALKEQRKIEKKQEKLQRDEELEQIKNPSFLQKVTDTTLPHLFHTKKAMTFVRGEAKKVFIYVNKMGPDWRTLMTWISKIPVDQMFDISIIRDKINEHFFSTIGLTKDSGLYSAVNKFLGKLWFIIEPTLGYAKFIIDNIMKLLNLTRSKWIPWYTAIYGDFTNIYMSVFHNIIGMYNQFFIIYISYLTAIIYYYLMFVLKLITFIIKL